MDRRYYTDWATPSPQNFLFHHKIYVIKMSTETRKSWVLATHVPPQPHPPPSKQSSRTSTPHLGTLQRSPVLQRYDQAYVKFWLPATRQPPRHVTWNQKPFHFVFSTWRHGFLWSTFSNRGLSVLSPSLRLYSLNAMSIFPARKFTFRSTST